MVSVATCVASAPAVAQTLSEELEGEERAAQFYQQASDAYGVGDYGRAAELLERAFAYDQNLVYKYNQILAIQGQGDYQEALRILDIYGDPLRMDGRFDDLDELKEELDEALQARQAKEAAQASAQAKEDGAVEPPPSPPPALPGQRSQILGWSLIGTGSAALATGVVFSTGVLISDATERLEGSRTPEDREAVYGDGIFNRDEDLATLKTHKILTVALLAGGAAVAGVGGVILFTPPRGDNASHSATLNLAPMLSPDVAGASINGWF